MSAPPLPDPIHPACDTFRFWRWECIEGHQVFFSRYELRALRRGRSWCVTFAMDRVLASHPPTYKLQNWVHKFLRRPTVFLRFAPAILCRLRWRGAAAAASTAAVAAATGSETEDSAATVDELMIVHFVMVFLRHLWNVVGLDRQGRGKVLECESMFLLWSYQFVCFYLAYGCPF